MSGKWSLYESINSKYIQDYFWFQIPSGININLECLFNTASWKSVCVGRVDRRLGFIAISKNTMESKKNLEILSKNRFSVQIYVAGTGSLVIMAEELLFLSCVFPELQATLDKGLHLSFNCNINFCKETCNESGQIYIILITAILSYPKLE